VKGEGFNYSDVFPFFLAIAAAAVALASERARLKQSELRPLRRRSL
jgi:hypothetical protein